MYISIILTLFCTLIFASDENNLTSSKIDKNIQKEIELEKKYKKEQRFYMGDEYDLKSKEIDKESVKSIPLIEPEYDFELDEF